MKRFLDISDDGTTAQEHTEMRLSDLRETADWCKAQRNAGAWHVGDKGTKHLARVPRGLVEKYCNDQGILFAEFMQNPEHATRMLNDPGLADFRIAPNNVGGVNMRFAGFRLNFLGAAQ